MVGGGADVDNDLGSGATLARSGAVVEPDVLTDVYTHKGAADFKYGETGAGIEVPVFVEDTVGGQVMFAVHALEPALTAYGSGVVDAAAHGVSVANDRRNATGLVDGFIDGFEVVAKEGAAEEEVFGGVAGDGHFGEGDNVGAGITGAIHELQDALHIGLQVSNDGVHLSQGDAKGAHYSPALSVYIRL